MKSNIQSTWLIQGLCLISCCYLSWAAQVPPQAPCKLLVDTRLAEPIRTLKHEYETQNQTSLNLQFQPANQIDHYISKQQNNFDVILCMSTDSNTPPMIQTLANVKTVAWKYPSGEPVWAAAVSQHPIANDFVDFIGGPVGHQIWSASKAGFTMTSGKTHAEAFDWVVENRVKHTYPQTAMRLLAELGGIRTGTCIDIGCGTGNLAVELAKRSKFKIIGLDIDPDMKPLFEKRVNKAQLQNRIHFVEGDAQALPFEDNSADVIVSRGTLTFIPDIGKCLREVDRVLKPTGVAVLGGRYLYTPEKHMITTDTLKRIVENSGVTGATVSEFRGQWVKIIGPRAPKAAKIFQGGPHLLVHRLIADYDITTGQCLQLCMNDNDGVRQVQQGLVETTDLHITALYPTAQLSYNAQKRTRRAKRHQRVTCTTGTLPPLSFAENTFDLIIGTGPMLIMGNRVSKIQDLYRVLKPGGIALVGGQFRHMPVFRKVPQEQLQATITQTGITNIKIINDNGQWIEIRKPEIHTVEKP